MYIQVDSPNQAGKWKHTVSPVGGQKKKRIKCNQTLWNVSHPKDLVNRIVLFSILWYSVILMGTVPLISCPENASSYMSSVKKLSFSLASLVPLSVLQQGCRNIKYIYGDGINIHKRCCER